MARVRFSGRHASIDNTFHQTVEDSEPDRRRLWFPPFAKAAKGAPTLLLVRPKPKAGAPGNSDPDASLYWLGQMLEAGEDPLYIARAKAATNLP